MRVLLTGSVGARMRALKSERDHLRAALLEITRTDYIPRLSEAPFQFEQRVHKIAADALRLSGAKEEAR